MNVNKHNSYGENIHVLYRTRDVQCLCDDSEENTAPIFTEKDNSKIHVLTFLHFLMTVRFIVMTWTVRDHSNYNTFLTSCMTNTQYNSISR
jgi:type IV secretory pathway VirB4 component